MKRSLKGAVAILAMLTAAPALAADYPEMRPAYPESWQNPDDDLRFEFGTRYWMSWGEQDAGFTAVSGGTTLGDVTISTRDQTHIGELHGKIEDLSTQTYLSGKAGLGLSTTGTYAVTPSSSGSIGRNSNIGYIGTDFGWLPWGDMDEGFSFGGLIGYQYWKDAPDIGSGQYGATFDGASNPTSFGTAKDDFDIHAVRLGVKGQAEYEQFDFQGEVAAIPYAAISGTLGGNSPTGYNFSGFGNFQERAPTTLTGRGYGVMAEGLVGFHPTENLTVRVGGRAWYLEGQLDAKFTSSSGGANLPTLDLPSNFARIFRYGALFELTGRF
ncbi:hypothetical protein [Devosia neptuniae]|uniref:hypothetical protein n=1 Tax=Devosia neptuniae TaxID=191302 RepID=UPI0022AEE385|nr:hypothetical protein [Devosia neptuniae]MCZ4344935.1 hypothetical protein [Devosia neptuniae]|tara:strand:- start:10450 stop:11427 length:978 start_codon:yes stop_codon:yes gene_type:complete